MDVELRNGSGADGIAAAEQLRANLAVPVVFLTAYADAATLDRAKRASPHGYVVTPFDEREPPATLADALQPNRDTPPHPRPPQPPPVPKLRTRLRQADHHEVPT